MKIKNKIGSLWNQWKYKPLGVKIFLSVFFLFFLVEAIIQIYPFLWVINNSLKSLDEFGEKSTFAITTSWKFGNYLKVFDEFVVNGTIGYWTMVWNSVWQTFLYLLVNLMSSLCVAYALAKFNFPGRGLLYGFMIFIQTIPVIGTGAAAYKLRYSLGMINNPALIWLCWAVGFDYSAFIMYGTLQGCKRIIYGIRGIGRCERAYHFVKDRFPVDIPLRVGAYGNEFRRTLE